MFNEKSFMMGKMFNDLLADIASGPNGDQIASIIDSCFLVVDIMFIIGLFLAFFGVVFSFMKYGLRIIKRNSDETDEREVINWRKELKGSMKGFAIFVVALISLPIFAAIITSIIQSVVVG
ncbi:MAG: hypothetical protein ACRCUM_02185 [Mycoplasmoidaceae bacterium]